MSFQAMNTYLQKYTTVAAKYAIEVGSNNVGWGSTEATLVLYTSAHSGPTSDRAHVQTRLHCLPL